MEKSGYQTNINFYKKKTMDEKEKEIYLDLALRMQDYKLDKELLYRLVLTYDLIVEKQGDTTMKDVCKIDAAVRERKTDKK